MLDGFLNKLCKMHFDICGTARILTISSQYSYGESCNKQKLGIIWLTYLALFCLVDWNWDVNWGGMLLVKFGLKL